MPSPVAEECIFSGRAVKCGLIARYNRMGSAELRVHGDIAPVLQLPRLSPYRMSTIFIDAVLFPAVSLLK